MVCHTTWTGGGNAGKLPEGFSDIAVGQADVVTREHEDAHVVGEKDRVRGGKPVRERGPVCKVLIREELCFDYLVLLTMAEHGVADLGDGILHLASGASGAIVTPWTAARHGAARAVIDWPMEGRLHRSLHVNPARAIRQEELVKGESVTLLSRHMPWVYLLTDNVAGRAGRPKVFTGVPRHPGDFELDIGILLSGSGPKLPRDPCTGRLGRGGG